MTYSPGRHASRERAPRNIPSLLTQLRQDRFTGAVVVEGGSGGTLFLRDGLVGAVESPAAPSVRSLLLKSSRIGEHDWEAALVAVGEDRPLAAVLTGRGIISDAELSVICTAALFDGAFAMALQPVTGWRLDPGRDPELGAWPGHEPPRLVEETGVRLRTLREQVASVGEFARTPVLPAIRTDVEGLGSRDRTLLLSVNGRRTPRDLAFATGRGVYPVMIDLLRLTARRFLVQTVEPHAPGPVVTARTSERPAPPPPADDAPLPRRSPGRNLPQGRLPANAQAPTAMSEEQRSTVLRLRLIRNALSDVPASPDGDPHTADPHTAETPTAETPTAQPPVADPAAADPAADRGTATGRHKEPAP